MGTPTKFIDKDGTEKMFDAMLDAVDKRIAKIPTGGGDADWNALDGQSGFIKNKPFGYNVLEQIISFTPDMVQEGDPFGWGGSFYFASVPVDAQNKLTLGDVYMVQLGDDAPALSQCRTGNDKGELALNIGFGQLNTTTIEDVQHFVFIAEEDFIGMTIKVWRMGVNKIDERFLPDFVTEMRDKIDRLTQAVFG